MKLKYTPIKNHIWTSVSDSVTLSVSDSVRDSLNKSVWSPVFYFVYSSIRRPLVRLTTGNELI